jgi:hypothetical protein
VTADELSLVHIENRPVKGRHDRHEIDCVNQLGSTSRHDIHLNLASLPNKIKVCIKLAHQRPSCCEQAGNASSGQTNAIQTPMSTEDVIGGAEVVNWYGTGISSIRWPSENKCECSEHTSSRIHPQLCTNKDNIAIFHIVQHEHK